MFFLDLSNALEAFFPSTDKRTNIQPIEFITGLVFHFQGDTRNLSLESIRRALISHLGVKISKSAFWERLSRGRLKNMLLKLVSELMANITGTALVGKSILTALSVSGIYLLDSSSITLWDGAKEDYPGSRTHAGIKWHFCFDLFSGSLKWFDFSPTSTHDSKFFPPFELLKGILIIFDLGYWDYNLLVSIKDAGGYFLSRVKTNSAIKIHKVISGISPIHAGKKLSTLSFKRRGSEVVELIGSIVVDKIEHHFRLVGFWNPEEKKYHWYITNLEVVAKILYSLYRLRWQIELIFKGHKGSLQVDQIPSNNDNIIQSLLLSSTAAHIAASAVLELGLDNITEEKKEAFSYQRLFIILKLLGNDFIKFLLSRSKKPLEVLISKIKLLSNEIFDPNYKRRKTSLGKLLQELRKIEEELNENCKILPVKREKSRKSVQHVGKKVA